MRRTGIIALCLLALALSFRLPDLGVSCNIDSVNHWFVRTRLFWNAVSDGRFRDTVYSPHPGVSLMWLSGLSLKAHGLLHALNERAVTAATLPVALASALLPPLNYLLLGRLLPRGGDRPHFAPVPLLSSFVLATEPFLVGHARTFHLDSLLVGFVWVATLLAALTLFERKRRWAVLAGVALGLALLTRLIAGVFAVSLAIPFAVAFLRERPRTKTLPLLLALATLTTALVTVAGWPALLVAPLETVTKTLKASARLVEHGHAMFAWGKAYSRDPGIGFYAGVLLMRLSPEVLSGALLFPWLLRRSARRTLLLSGSLAAVYLPYTLAVLLGAKKGDRYLLFLYPLLGLYASITAVELLRSLRSRRWSRHQTAALVAVVALLGVGRIGRLARVHPMPIAWCAGYPGLRCEDVITIGTGEGFRDVALWIREHSKVKVPKVLSAYRGGVVMRPWLTFTRPEHFERAQFVVTYIASDQRRKDVDLRAFSVGEPLHEVIYDGRVYARIYKGRRYREALK